MVNTPKRTCAGDTMAKQNINIGIQSNDGTGDSIREAFRKTNENFQELYGLLGAYDGFRFFAGLEDTPSVGEPRKLLVTNSSGTTVTQISLVGKGGIQIDFNYGSGLSVANTVTNLWLDPNPKLGNDLIGYGTGTVVVGTATQVVIKSWRAKEFADPLADQDLVTRKFLYDNFLSRNSNTITGDEDTIFVGTGSSVLSANINLIPTSTNWLSFNTTTFITVYDSTGTLKNISLAVQGTSSTHITRKDYVDTKISLQGVDTIDPETGLVNPGFGKMTGPLILSRDPETNDDKSYAGLIAASKKYVDDNDYFSSNNIFVTMKGRDYQPLTPPERRGRSQATAFGTVNKAAQVAEKLIATSQIIVGDYARNITYNNGIAATVFDVVDNFYGNNLARLRLYVAGNGSDQFGAVDVGQYTIFPGQYIQGVDSGAIALIENIADGENNGDPEIYSIAYVDYGDDFDTPIVTSIPNFANPNVVKMTFSPNGPDQIIPIPEFWVGYKFYTDTGVPNGTIIDVGAEFITDLESNQGIYTNYFVVEFESGPPGDDQTFAADEWHVYAGDFFPGEEVVYNTNVAELQITLVVESGDYKEDYPIRLPANVSIRGDEFRRTVIRPANRISSSPWADIYFRRDAQVDGLQAASLNTTTDYAVGGTLVSANITPDGSSGVVTFSLSVGTFPSSYVGYVFVGNQGQGEIISSTDGSFTVNLGAGLLNANTIAYGDYSIYEPVRFGYHYLKDPTRPKNIFVTAINNGAYSQAATIINKNRGFIQQEITNWMLDQVQLNSANTASIWYNYTFNISKSIRDTGTLVDGIAYDLLYGGSGRTINNADRIRNADLAGTACAEGIKYLSTVTLNLLTSPNVAMAKSPSNTATQFTTSTLTIEPGVASVTADLLNAAYRIIRADPVLDVDYNPPKNSQELDVFLMNDANVIRYVSCQNHGGFMQVLDPLGQIRNKSPYTQTASSFSQSENKQVFRGGMLVDGFSGNVLATPVDFTDPLRLEVSGLIRRPQVPTFFVNGGIRYEVNFFANFRPTGTLATGETTYSATLRLNPLSPGGLSNNVSVVDSEGGFQNSRNTGTNIIPIIIEQPTGIGGLGARGYAESTDGGYINRIVINFPGTGYTSTPFISIGGARLNNLVIVNGQVTNANIVSGGTGYKVGCRIEIIPVGIVGGVKAVGQVTEIDNGIATNNGTITGISFSNGGSNWNDSVAYRVAFGNLDISIPTPQAGYLDVTPSQIELVTAGNRSMLANDFTQVNDLGYGIFVTNGGFMENVSMFTYYCHRSYFALNGSQVRTLTGSSVYGNYGLVADGKDPTEVPLSLTSVFPLTQVASAYVVNPLYPAQPDQTYIYVEIDPVGGGYPPLNGSQIEVNHNGVRRNYSIGAASPALDANNVQIPNVYQLFFNTGNLSSSTAGAGLESEVLNGEPIIIRASTLVKVTGFNPVSITRPSTTLTWNDNPSYVYNITGFSTVQPDGSVFAYTQQDYNYITFQTVSQGVRYPSLVNGGSGYSSTNTSIVIGTAGLVSGINKTAVGDQGLNTIGIQRIVLNNVSNLVVGQVLSTSTYILPETYVTYVDQLKNLVCLSNPTNGPIADGTAFEFNAVLPVARAEITSGTITNILIDEGGGGWAAGLTTIAISGTGTNALVASPVGLAGKAGSTTIKITTLDITSQNRIASGLLQNPPQYFQFAFGNDIYSILEYRSPTDMGGQSFAEIDIDKPLAEDIGRGTILRAGIPIASQGELTTKISILRATGHDFVDIGVGGYASARIPNDLYGPPLQQRIQTNEVIEINRGRVYYVTSDQDGNVRIGKALVVNQAQGSVTISVPLDLSNLSSLSLRRDLGPPVNEFSIDSTMVTEADYKVPTEQAVANYINRRLGIDRNGNIYPGSPLGPQFLSLDGQLAMKADLNMGNVNRIVNLQTPAENAHASTKGYTDTKISNAGTAAIDVDGSTLKYEWGNMTGGLHLYRDPEVKYAVVATTATVGATVITFTNLTNTGVYQPGDFFRHRVNIAGVPTGTVVTTVFSDNVRLGLGDEVTSNNVAVTQTIPAGTIVAFDPIYQGATKRYVDINRQFNQLVDGRISTATDTDFLMFGPPMPVSTSTAPSLWTSSTMVLNVRNNINPILNTPTGIGGGSDITVTRTNNTVTFKLVGGTLNEATNPITDYHVNSWAQIKQSKLLMNTATTTATAWVGTQSQIQNRLGLSSFDSRMFTATSGWVTLVNSTGTSSGIQTMKQAWVPVGGGLLGATNTAADTSASYVTSATVKVWLQNEATNWRYSSTLLPNSDITYDLGSGALRWRNAFVSTATLTGGLTLNTSSIIRGDQTTAWIFSSTVTDLNIGLAGGRLTTPGILASNTATVTLYNATATTVNAFGAATAIGFGAATGTLTVGNPTLTMTNGTTFNMNGASPSIVTSNAGTASVFNTNALTGNLFGAATSIAIGAATGTLTVGNPTLTMTNGTTLNMNGASPSIVTSNSGTGSLFNTNILTGQLFGAATTVSLGVAATTANLGTTAGSATTFNIGNSANSGNILQLNSTAAGTANIRTGVTTGIVNIATGVTTGNINLGSAAAGYLQVAFNSAASNTTNGALRVTGGAGIGGNLYAAQLYDNGNRAITNVDAATSGNGISVSAETQTGPSASFTISSNATSANTPSTLVFRDAAGNFSAQTINATLTNTVAGGSDVDLVYANMADNDFFRLRVGGTTNSGYVEIATADDGTEPIYVRQYSGVFTTLTRTATLLDGSGNTSFPGRVTANGGLSTGNLATISGSGTVDGNWTLNAGATWQATFADLAEWYSSDAIYEPGTVLVFGGTDEVTTTNIYADSRVAGVVSTDAAYILNAGLKDTRAACIALQGRVPVKVLGRVRKGDMLTTADQPGYATKAIDPKLGTIIGKALADKDYTEAGVIEVAVGRM